MGENKNSLIVLYTKSDVYLNKKDELVLQIDQYRPDIVAIVEVLPKNMSPIQACEFKIEGYICYMNEKPKRGVLIYVKDNIKA